MWSARGRAQADAQSRGDGAGFVTEGQQTSEPCLGFCFWRIRVEELSSGGFELVTRRPPGRCCPAIRIAFQLVALDRFTAAQSGGEGWFQKPRIHWLFPPAFGAGGERRGGLWVGVVLLAGVQTVTFKYLSWKRTAMSPLP